jgi:hypothetical protein
MIILCIYVMMYICVVIIDSGPLKRLLPGLSRGDARVDALPMSAVCCHGGKTRSIGLEKTPDWVNVESIRRGQAIFLKHLAQNYTALTIALIQGFSISRFAEVLFANGYAQSPETAFERYRTTSFFIMDWFSHPLELDAEDQIAIDALQTVRAMHSFSRRKTMQTHPHLFEGEAGIPLSQYDMAEVQLGFAGIASSIVEIELGATPLTRQEKQDLCHAWRLIGYWLGIEDEFNVCNDLDDMNAMVAEYMLWTPRRFETCRPCTFELQRTAIEGFGQYTGLGAEFFTGMVHFTCSSRGMDIDYLKRKSLFGLRDVGSLSLQIMGYSPINYLASAGLLRLRNEWRHREERQRVVVRILSHLSRPLDILIWRLIGLQILFLRYVVFRTQFQLRLYTFILGWIIMNKIYQRIPVVIGMLIK